MALSTLTQDNEQTSSALGQPNEQSGQNAQGKFSATRSNSNSNSNGVQPIEDIVPFQSAVTPRLIISIEGEEKTGKNHFAFTAPGPIYLQTCDPSGIDGVAQKFPGKVFTPRDGAYQLKVSPSECSTSDMKKLADPLLDKWVANYRAALRKVRTIVWDTADELWELARLAKFGELTPKLSQGDRNNQYGELNSFYEGLIKEAFGYPVNFILIHRVKDEYKNNARSGARIRAGYKDVYFLTQVNLRTGKWAKMDTNGNRVGTGFGVQVIDCRRNPDIEGQVIANSFPELALKVLPEVDPDTWI